MTAACLGGVQWQMKECRLRSELVLFREMMAEVEDCVAQVGTGVVGDRGWYP